MAFCSIDFSQIASVSHITLITSCRSNEMKPNWMKTKRKLNETKKPTSVLSYLLFIFKKSTKLTVTELPGKLCPIS